MNDVDSELMKAFILQLIDVLADHDRKYFAISCLMFCYWCPPPCVQPLVKWPGARAPCNRSLQKGDVEAIAIREGSEKTN